MTRQKYGEELRLRREAAGHTQQSLGDVVIMSPSMIAHIEAGRRRPHLEDAQRIDKELHTGSFFERWLPTLDEAVLRTVAGGPTVMAGQLRHVAALIRSGRVQVQVLPFSSGAHPFLANNLQLMRFAEGPDEAYFEVLYTGALTDDPVMVRRYREAYDLARAAALPLMASLELIESVAKEYDNVEQAHP